MVWWWCAVVWCGVVVEKGGDCVVVERGGDCVVLQ